jgi:hypothetical protein
VAELEISNALTATDKIIRELGKRDLRDKIVLLKLVGKLKQGKTSNINFKQIEDFVKEMEAFVLLKSTSKLVTEEPEFELDIENMDKLEDEIIENYMQQNKSKFNSLIHPLINTLSLEKLEGETSSVFQTRLFFELEKAIKIKIN